MDGELELLTVYKPGTQLDISVLIINQRFKTPCSIKKRVNTIILNGYYFATRRWPS